MSNDIELDENSDIAYRPLSVDKLLCNMLRSMDMTQAWHEAMPLQDHDGGDEDDALVELRRFARAMRKPRAQYFRIGDRMYVVQGPDSFAPMPWFVENR